MRPTVALMLAHPAHFLAMGFGTGLAPIGPGTIGTLLAIPLYAVLLGRYSPLEVLALCVLLFAIGVWVCDRTGRDMGIDDHGSVTWDEIVAFLVVLSIIPSEWTWQIAAFVVFRLFDILKPPPIRRIDQRVKGGIGAMLDDLCAAFYTLIVLAVVKVVL